MTRTMPLRFSATLFLVLCSATLGWCDEAAPKSASDKPADDSKPEAAKVTKISGVLEAIQAAEISTDTKHLSSLEIRRIAKHGSLVSKGKNVVVLETKEIDKQIKNAEIDYRLSKFALDDDEFNYQQFQKIQALDRTAAKRTRRLAQQAFDNFAQVDRDRQVLSAEFSIKASQASLDNALEELQQLEQMYKEDDLTEESEEIVLKRAKQAVDSARYRFDGTKITSKRRIDQSIPHTQLQQDDALARAEMAYQKSIRDLTSARQRRDIEISRKRDKLKEEESKLSELKAERKKVVLMSPFDGIVLHGPLNRGRLGGKPSVLEVGTKVTSKQVIATVVNPKKLRIRVDLEEKDLSVAVVGATCTVTSKVFPEFSTVGTVKSVSTIAYAGTKHDCVISFRRAKNQPALLPTMTCDLEFVAKPASGGEQGAERKGKKKRDLKMEEDREDGDDA